MSIQKPDIIEMLRDDDVVEVLNHADNLPDIDHLHNNGAGGPPLTLAWMAAFLGARKSLTAIVTRGANLDFLANNSTVRRLALLKCEALLGLIEAGVSPNADEMIVLFLSDFENQLPKSEAVALFDAVIRELPDLSLDGSEHDVARIRSSMAFQGSFRDTYEALRAGPAVQSPEMMEIASAIEHKLQDIAAKIAEGAAQSLALLTANLPLFETTVKRYFAGYRKNREWLTNAATKARVELQRHLAAPLDLYEDDEDLIHLIELVLARYPIREVVAGAEAKSRPLANDGRNFEKEGHDALVEAGFLVERTPVTGDQGADLIASRDGLIFVIQCKNYAAPVGNFAVQEVLGARSFYKSDYAVVCAPCGYTKSAKALAATSGVLLLSPDLLPELWKLRLLVE